MTPTATAALDLQAFRAEFPALEERHDGKRLVYLDSACSALKSRRVASVLAEATLALGSCGGKRSSHLLSQRVEERFTRARQAVARWLNADTPNCVVFTSGTTEGANWVARAFPYTDARREVVLGGAEHNSCFLPFYEQAREGRIGLKVLDSPDGRLDLERLKDAVSERTALVVLTRASNVLGGVEPAAEAVRLARRKGARVLLDDAQFLSSHREDVQASDADFVVFSGHKLGGPFGTGVLYGKETLLNSMRPHKVGGGTVKDVRLSDGEWQVDYLDAPHRFEAGVQNVPGALGLAEALALLEAAGVPALRSHAAALVGRAFDRLAAVDGIRVLGERARLAEGALVSFVPEKRGFSLHDFNLFLNHELAGHVVALRVGEHCAHALHRRLGAPQSARLSFFGYSTAEEVDLACDAVTEYLRHL